MIYTLYEYGYEYEYENEYEFEFEYEYEYESEYVRPKLMVHMATHYILPKIEIVFFEIVLAFESGWMICVHYHSLGVKKNRFAHQHCDWGWKMG